MAPSTLDTLLAESYLDGLGELSTPELRRMRATCEEHERAVSFARRVLQGRLDILRAELQRRDERGDAAAGSLLSRLPDILGHDHVATDPAHARAAPLEIPDVAQDLRERVDEIVDEETLLALPEREADELEALVERLSGYERELSGTRRALFDRIDRIRDELADRYKDGRASIAELLGTDS